MEELCQAANRAIESGATILILSDRGVNQEYAPIPSLLATSGVHHHLVPGEGAIDFKATLEAIRAIGYDGWITIELYPYVEDPDAAARLALERMKDEE